MRFYRLDVIIGHISIGKKNNYESFSSKLKHGPQFALICSTQKWWGGLYLRALDVDT